MIISTKILNEEKNKYIAFPESLKSEQRWVCFRKTEIDNRITKQPVNAYTGALASSTNPKDWCDFDDAIEGKITYGLDGIGIVLGDGLCGIDLDNHADKSGKPPMTDEQFDDYSRTIINMMDSYAELSPSGKGVHILFKGSFPEAKKRASKEIDGILCPIEMYQTGRYFTVTGDTINGAAVNERTDEALEVWKTYVSGNEEPKKRSDERRPQNGEIPVNLNEQEIIEKIRQSKESTLFNSLYSGDLVQFNGDHSAADMALCCILAFWCNFDMRKMDSIFRSSGLMRDKWDEMRGAMTYGNLTLTNAVNFVSEGYQPYEKVITPTGNTIYRQYKPIVRENQQVVNYSVTNDDGDINMPDKSTYMTVDENGIPNFNIIDVPTSIKTDYGYTDRGNAERFYAFFGDIIKYNTEAKKFIYWDGTRWVDDKKKVTEKFLDRMVRSMMIEADEMATKIKEYEITEDEEKAKALKEKHKALKQNINKLESKSGRNDCLEVYKGVNDVAVIQSQFDSQSYLLNTNSGTLDMRDMSLRFYDKSLMLSKKTNAGISFNSAPVWNKFLEDIFYRGNTEEKKQETRELIDTVQQIFGMSLMGEALEQYLFIFNGEGSNGKSTLINIIEDVFGDYAKSMDSSSLMTKATQNSQAQYELAELIGKRLVITSETDEGERLSEKLIKKMTGGDTINARKLYSDPITFKSKYTLIMMTNNLPVIKEDGYAAWRRMFVVPFDRKFTDKEKDVNLPKKLEMEKNSILAWCAEGYRKYVENGSHLIMPKCIKEASEKYRRQMDVISKFLEDATYPVPYEENDTATYVNAEDLYKAYIQWSMNQNERKISERQFQSKIISRGYSFVSKGIGYKHHYCGLHLNDRYTDAIGYTYGVK